MNNHKFINAYPLSFELFDGEAQNVLYIENEVEQKLVLHIVNQSSQELSLNGSTDSIDVGQDNYQIALRFRANTLAANSLSDNEDKRIKLMDDASWQMSLVRGEVAGTQKMDVIYLRAKVEVKLASGDHLNIVFDNVSASGAQGSRGTRAVMSYENMQLGSDVTPISGSVETHLRIINHQGKKEFPLHIGFVGDNGVLNDGTTKNGLTIRFSNASTPDSISSTGAPITFEANVDETKRSKIIISFLAGNTKELWALGTETQVKGIKANPPTGWGLRPLGVGSFEFYPEGNNVTLTDVISNPQSSFFNIVIGNIITGHRAGHTHVYVRYENIPGYWDGQRILVIERRPFRFNDGNPSKKVMLINNKVWVEDNLWAQQKVVIGKELIVNDFLEARQNVSIGKELTVTGHLHAKGNIFQSGNDFNLGLEPDPQDASKYKKWQRALVNKKNDNGDHDLVINYANDFAGGTTINGEPITLTGHTHIGESLTVEGSIVQKGNHFYLGQKNDGKLACALHNSGTKLIVNHNNGFPETWINGPRIVLSAIEKGVGINIADPKAPLHVNHFSEMDAGSGSYFAWDRGHVRGTTAHNKVNYTIIASEYMRAKGYFAISDSRTKTNLRISDSVKDLQTLQAIEVTDYQMKDKVQNGDQWQKKLIGQQLKEVFPQAVSTTIETIPDIYQKATIANGWVNLPNTLKVGEKVKLIFKDKEEMAEVLRANAEGFEVTFKKEADQEKITKEKEDEQKADEVFVYGREVDDFLVVDYEEVSMLNVSATQQLIKENQAQKAQIDAQQVTIDQLQQQMAQMMARLDKLEQISNQTVVES